MSNKSLIIETLESLNEFLPKIAAVCLSIAEQLREEDVTSAMQNINEFADAIEWTIQAINGIKKLNYSLNINTAEINEYLVEAQEGLAENDLIVVADMFEYEVHPKIEEWLQEIRSVRAQ